MAGSPTLLYSEQKVRSRVEQLGRSISRDYTGRPPVLVSVLKGGIVFLADLMRAIDLPLSVDFMSISKYGERAPGSGVVRILKDLDHDIGGQDVIVVEDIIDTGLTLSYLLTALWARHPASIEVCALLDKAARRIAPLDIRYRGFECPDLFVVGYGLDHGERFRNLPFILAMPPGRSAEEWPELEPYLEGPPPEGG